MSSWEASTRGAYAAEIRQIRQILEQIVRENPGGGHISYIALLRQMPRLPQDIEGQHILWRILGCVSLDTYREGLGMLSVIVWNEEENQPGPGFYVVAKQDCGRRRLPTRRFSPENFAEFLKLTITGDHFDEVHKLTDGRRGACQKPPRPFSARRRQ